MRAPDVLLMWMLAQSHSVLQAVSTAVGTMCISGWWYFHAKDWRHVSRCEPSGALLQELAWHWPAFDEVNTARS